MFGLWNQCPDEATQAWGARAIWKRGRIDLLPDRQDTRPGTSPAFLAALNAILPKARTKAALLQFDGLRSDSDELVTLFDLAGITVKACCNKSCGYLYLIAYSTPIEGIWSGEGAIPEAGDAVDSIIGKGRVAGHFEESGYHGVSVLLDAPPAWLVKQNGHGLVGLFGRELK